MGDTEGVKHPGFTSLCELGQDSILLTLWRLQHRQVGQGQRQPPILAADIKRARVITAPKLPTWAFQLRAHYLLNNCIDLIDTIC